MTMGLLLDGLLEYHSRTRDVKFEFEFLNVIINIFDLKYFIFSVISQSSKVSIHMTMVLLLDGLLEYHSRKREVKFEFEFLNVIINIFNLKYFIFLVISQALNSRYSYGQGSFIRCFFLTIRVHGK